MTIPERHVRVKSLTFYNRTIHIHVDTETGTFWVYDDDGNRLKYGTDWEQTIWKARGMLRRTLANVEIPFRTKSGRVGVALNIHSGTGNVTIQFPGERKQQIDKFDAGRKFYRPETTDEELAEVERLQRIINERSTQLRALNERISIDLGVAVQEAVDAKIKATDEASWGTATPGVLEPDDPADEEAALEGQAHESDGF
jgi:hypothetical protein